MVAAAETSKSEATDQDSRQEGKYDMRAQSAAYLAEGQAKLATELAAAIEAYRTMKFPDPELAGLATVSSLITLKFNSVESLYFIGPTRGGLELEIEGKSVTVITASSPVGRQLLDKKIGHVLLLGKNMWSLAAIS